MHLNQNLKEIIGFFFVILVMVGLPTLFNGHTFLQAFTWSFLTWLGILVFVWIAHSSEHTQRIEKENADLKRKLRTRSNNSKDDIHRH
jgi:protein-S-isoprenylcysteine O-methyltransferase Ste14